MNIYCHHANCKLLNHIVRLWTRSYFKIAKSSVCLLCLSLCIFSLNHDTRSKKAETKKKVVVCCCWKKFNLLLDFSSKKQSTRPQHIWKNGGACTSVVKQTASKLKSNNKPPSKTTQICLPYLIRKIKGVSCFAERCLAHNRNITVFGYGVKSLFIKHCPFL